MWFRRVLEIVGQTVLGDGVTCLIVPRKHMLLWRDAFSWQWWRKFVQWFTDRPNATIVTGVVECLIGLAMIRRASRDV